MAKKLTRSNSKSPKPLEKSEVWIHKEVYGQAPEKYHFVLKDGKKLKDLKELAESLRTMNDDVFRHHVNDVINDFSNWVRDVFNDRPLAEELKKFRSKTETELTLYKHFENKLNNTIEKLISGTK